MEVFVPFLYLEMHPGRTVDQKRNFVREATRVAVETLDCPINSVEIIISEVSKDSWAVAGVLKSDT
ncbi:MAG TPA: 4-oxalocrotonate tautomerase [Gemmatimonadaceae bacterium]|nr:4-oxalocrotonate tautomerase [Gemmatimonadaceae bacterium]